MLARASAIVLLASAAHGACPGLDAPTIAATVADSSLTEISGIAASRLEPGTTWVEEDSGNAASIYQLSAAGARLRSVAISGADNTDWEDIAVLPAGPGSTPTLFVADTGDNNQSRTDARIYVLPEPPAGASSATAQVLPLRYPASAKFDAETLLADPVTGDLFLVTRDRADEGFARVFRYAAPYSPGVSRTLEASGTISHGGTGLFKGGDVSPAGDQVALLRHDSSSEETAVLVYSRRAGTSVADALAGTPCTVVLPATPQSEALCFGAATPDIFVTGEATRPPIYRLAARSLPTSTLSVR